MDEQFNKIKKEMINAALKACEKHGYPSSDEPLCLLIEDALDFAYTERQKEIDELKWKLELIQKKVNAQAEDEGLWFYAEFERLQKKLERMKEIIFETNPTCGDCVEAQADGYTMCGECSVPYCSGCGSMTMKGCNCGPIADND